MHIGKSPDWGFEWNGCAKDAETAKDEAWSLYLDDGAPGGYEKLNMTVTRNRLYDLLEVDGDVVSRMQYYAMRKERNTDWNRSSANHNSPSDAD